MATVPAYMMNTLNAQQAQYSPYQAMQSGQGAGIQYYSPGGQQQISNMGNLQNTAEQGRWAIQGMQEQGNIQKALEEARWKRAMEFINGGTFQGMWSGAQGGGGQYGEQSAALQSYPAIRNYENEKRDVANRMGSRGMSLGVSADNAYGNAYGNLSRSLAEAGTMGQVKNRELQQSMLAQLLQFARP